MKNAMASTYLIVAAVVFTTSGCLQPILADTQNSASAKLDMALRKQVCLAWNPAY